MPDTFYFFLKLAAAVVSGVYGFYATVTDFRIEKKGQKVLSSKGYFGLALLVLATAISLSTDISKERRDKKDADRLEGEVTKLVTEGTELHRKLAQTSDSLGEQVAESRGISDKLDRTGAKLDSARRSIESTAGTTRNVLEQTHRILDPITREGLSLDVIIRVPDQAAVRPYLERLRQLKDQGHDIYRSLEPDDEEYPDQRRPEERNLARLANFKAVEIDFGIHVDANPNPTFIVILRGRCGSGEEPDSDIFEWTPSGAHPSFQKTVGSGDTPSTNGTAMMLECNTSDVGWNAPQFVKSWEDLYQTEILVQIHEASDDSSSTNAVSPPAQIRYSISEVMGTQGNSHRFAAFHLVPCAPTDKYPVCFTGGKPVLYGP